MGYQTASKKMTFITIGYIEWRKGQDLLVDAVLQIPEEFSNNVEFILVGQNTSLMAKELADRISNIGNIKMLGTVSREEVHRLLEDSDVMLCPSREDPMPTVCAEAMMHHIPCLVSDSIGTSAYIRDGYDGLIFKNESVEELKGKIVWCIQHQDELSKMGDRAYRIYEKIFSENAFEHNLLMHVEEMIGKAGC